jgi:hypothetical protein
VEMLTVTVRDVPGDCERYVTNSITFSFVYILCTLTTNALI